MPQKEAIERPLFAKQITLMLSCNTLAGQISWPWWTGNSLTQRIWVKASDNPTSSASVDDLVRSFCSYCATRILSPNEDDEKKLSRISHYIILQGIWRRFWKLVTIFVFYAFVDASFLTWYNDMKSVTGVVTSRWTKFEWRAERGLGSHLQFCICFGRRKVNNRDN